jgi:O-succinylhomoserine sulfhydrylase
MFAFAKLGYQNDCTHPASTTHSKLSVDERLAVSITMSVSVGLETVKDVIADLEQALA